MQFGSAVEGGTQTTLEQIRQMFAALSREMSIDYPTHALYQLQVEGLA